MSMFSANLLRETEADLRRSGHSWDDVEFIGSRDGKHGFTVERFRRLADVTYDSGYGGPEVPLDLVVVFSDGSWLERADYDGSEWWAYRLRPKVAPDCTWDQFTSVTAGEGLEPTVADMPRGEE